MQALPCLQICSHLQPAPHSSGCFASASASPGMQAQNWLLRRPRFPGLKPPQMMAKNQLRKPVLASLCPLHPCSSLPGSLLHSPPSLPRLAKGTLGTGIFCPCGNHPVLTMQAAWPRPGGPQRQVFRVGWALGLIPGGDVSSRSTRVSSALWGWSWRVCTQCEGVLRGVPFIPLSYPLLPSLAPLLGRPHQDAVKQIRAINSLWGNRIPLPRDNWKWVSWASTLCETKACVGAWRSAELR